MRRFFLIIQIVGGMLLATTASASTLETIRERGYLNCGVGTALRGFAEVNESGNWFGREVRICNAVADRVLGHAERVKHVSLGAKEDVSSLLSGEIDLLVTRRAWQGKRDLDLGLRLAGVYYVDGQGLMAHGHTNIRTTDALAGTTVCVLAGSSDELNLLEFGRKRGLKLNAIPLINDLWEQYFNNACDVVTAQRLALKEQNNWAEEPSDHYVLGELITHDLFGPLIRAGDDKWYDIVRFVLSDMLVRQGLDLIPEQHLAIATYETKEMTQSIFSGGTDNDGDSTAVYSTHENSANRDDPFLPLSNPPADETDSKGYVTTEVYYATDRVEDPDEDPKARFGNTSWNMLRYGIAEVSIPTDREPGSFNTPSLLRFEIIENAEKHIVLQELEVIDQDSFFSRLTKRLDDATFKDAFVFVHGFNVSFEDAARRAAQIHHDLSFGGVPMLFSWAASSGWFGGMSEDALLAWILGSPLIVAPIMLIDYKRDEVNAERAIPHLETFLRQVKTRTGAQKVHIIAHSMGNRPLLRALERLDGKARKFHEIAFAAPDVDAQVFQDSADRIIENESVERMTLYASDSDKALQLSKALNGYRRAGDVGENILVMPGIDTIDASRAGDGLLGHSYYGDKLAMLGDIIELFVGLTPEMRKGMDPSPRPVGNFHYWSLR